MKRIVIALGGNAILKKGERPTIETQLKNTRKSLEKLFPIIKKNKVVITHGNGPAVGYLLLQNEMARSKVSRMPLDVLDAETEGQIGYLIQQNLQNLFRKKKIKRNIITVLTQVLVSKKDRAFDEPTKFIGPYYNKIDAKRLSRKYEIRKDSNRGWRRVVASPKPKKLIESKLIRKLFNQGIIVIAAGGGGIPVIKERGLLKGVEAVVDKDLASSRLAISIKADTFIIVTDVNKVYLDYDKKKRIPIKRANIKKMLKFYKEGHFPQGSMGPKIEAAIWFLLKGGKKVIITDIANIEKAIKGKGGTTIIK